MVVGEVPPVAVLLIGYLAGEKTIKWHAFNDDREPH
jgi:hypothetical protein